MCLFLLFDQLYLLEFRQQSRTVLCVSSNSHALMLAAARECLPAMESAQAAMDEFAPAPITPDLTTFPLGRSDQ